MSHDSVRLPPAESELSRLVESMCDGTIVSQERDRLELLLENDRDAQLFYVAYLDLHAQMQWMMRGEEKPAESDPYPSLPSPPLDFLSTTLPGNVGFFSSGWPVAYLIATVICGVSLLIGSLVPVSEPVAGCQAIVGAQSVGRRTEDGDCWQDYRHDRLQVGGVRGQGSGVRASGQWSVASGQWPETVNRDL